ncbi:hypothetical protein P280DRAFT_51719 [Massarina eburnea CBS 473.64]|uniref:Uncharacterized protein n=1 Tax=Massarina eburnea CBS 473.64 TaxID=1395130 RepID=A0A6A6S0Y1_9PLEO|nr:hypothetical protein P280DRAFT_51719 [Massarina eburnea CBS 473.64]
MASPLPAPKIDLLLNLIDTRPSSILSSLAQHPHLASASDAHGYSLVHASVSYGQLDLLRELIRTYSANANILDEDGETPLFVAETVQAARCLLEELGADPGIRNAEGKTAEEKFLAEEGESNEVYQYLKSLQAGASSAAQTTSTSPGVTDTQDVHPPPPLPNGVNVEVGTMAEEAVGEAPDPEIRRRIEELAARDDFQTEEGQRLLRRLVEEVVTGMGGAEADRSVRRRVD